MFIYYWLNYDELIKNKKDGDKTEICNNTEDCADTVCYNPSTSGDDDIPDANGITVIIIINKDGCILINDNKGFPEYSTLSDLEKNLNIIKPAISIIDLEVASDAPTKVIDSVKNILRKRNNLKINFHLKKKQKLQ